MYKFILVKTFPIVYSKNRQKFFLNYPQKCFMCKHKAGQTAYPGICVGAKVRAQLLAREGHEVLVSLPEGLHAVIRFDDLKDPSWWSTLMMSKNVMDVIKVKIIRIDAQNQIYVVPTDFCAKIMSDATQANISLLEDEVSTDIIIKGKEEKISRLKTEMSRSEDKFRFGRKIVRLKNDLTRLYKVKTAILNEKEYYKTSLSF